MTDNGRATPGYNAGMRGNKSTVYDGGIKSPFFALLAGQAAAGRRLDRIAMHIDIAPTILEICGVKKPADLTLDGRSIWPRSTGSKPTGRTERSSRKVIGATSLCCTTTSPPGTKSGSSSARRASVPKRCRERPKFELFDMASDPYEQHDVAAQHADIAAKLKAEYEAWFKDVGSTPKRQLRPAANHRRSPHEKTTVLTRPGLAPAPPGDPTTKGIG